MATTDTSEKGLEALIVRHMTGQTAVPPAPGIADSQPWPQQVLTAIGIPADYTVGGYVPGQPADYNRDVALDVVKLLAFLQDTQPRIVDALELGQEGIKRTQFLHRMQGEIAKRGVVDVLRKGVSHGPVHVDLYKFLPTPGNASSAENFARNIFSVTRQLRYSNNETARSLDMAIFINGLPVATFELKNSLTKQTVVDAITQYQTDRDPRELLFQLGRCVVHFALDDCEVAFCTHLNGKASWFLPFNQGWNSGAGNPPNEFGLKTDYLWKQVLAKESLANIIENFAQIVEEEDERGRKKRKQVFPRFHQLCTVRALLRLCWGQGVGHRYLIQHSAGSGKSNTIAWLAHQLVELKLASDANTAQFDSVIVITDRRALDQAIAKTIKGYDHVASIFGHSDNAEELRGFLHRGKKIIVTTVQKFPFILDELGDLGSRRFALLIDEAHSSQGGKTTAKMHMALSSAPGDDEGDEESVEDAVNRLIELRKMLPNASYFAFTATPKNKTLELFGERYEVGSEVHFRSPPELTYTTKQAIQEGFILDVMKNYTPVYSFYRVAKTVEDDPNFDKIRALKKIRHYVESHDKAIRRKAEIMVDHFVAQVAGKRKIGGHPMWEKLSIFLNFLIPKLPAPKEEDLSKGVLDAIDMDSYRPEVVAALNLDMVDEDGIVNPAPPDTGGGGVDPDIDKLSNIIKTFNDLFGNIDWKDADKIRKVITEEIPNRVAQDKAYQNAAQNSDKENAKLEHDKALNRVVLELLADHTELFKQFKDNPNFNRWLTDTVFDTTYRPGSVSPKTLPQMGLEL